MSSWVLYFRKFKRATRFFLFSYFYLQNVYIYGQDTASTLPEGIKINTIQSPILAKGNNDSDLASLDIFKNKSIIILGEQDHRDGATLDLKNRIVKYLHEKEGFNVLIEERDAFSGEYFSQQFKKSIRIDSLALEEGQRMRDYKSSDSVLFNYLKQQQSSAHPLIFSGMDIMSTSESSTYRFPSYLKEILKRYEMMGSSFNSKIQEMGDLFSEIASDRNQADKRKLRKLKLYVDYFENKIDSTIKSVPIDSTLPLELVRRYLNDYYESLIIYKSISVLSKASEEERLSTKAVRLFLNRDSLMAENAIWLIKNIFPDEKIIISCSNYHAITAYIPEISCDNQLNEDMNGIYPMGYYLRKEFGAKLYSIATIEYDGTRYINSDDRPGKYRSPIENRSPATLEYKLSKMGNDYAFVNLNQACFNKSNCFVMFPTWNKEYNVAWQKAYDGLFFIKTMYGITWRNIVELK